MGYINPLRANNSFKHIPHSTRISFKKNNCNVSTRVRMTMKSSVCFSRHQMESSQWVVVGLLLTRRRRHLLVGLFNE